MSSTRQFLFSMNACWLQAVQGCSFLVAATQDLMSTLGSRGGAPVWVRCLLAFRDRKDGDNCKQM